MAVNGNRTKKDRLLKTLLACFFPVYFFFFFLFISFSISISFCLISFQLKQDVRLEHIIEGLILSLTMISYMLMLTVGLR